MLKTALFVRLEAKPGRSAHLSGKVAAALMAKAAELLSEPPAIAQLDILATTLP